MSRRTANKKHAKLYWPSRKRSSKTTNCTCTAKKWRARQKFFGACPTLQLSNSSRCHYPSDPATSAPWFLPEIAAMKTIYHLLTYLHMWSWQVCSSTHFPYPSLLPLPPFPIPKLYCWKLGNSPVPLGNSGKRIKVINVRKVMKLTR